MSKKTVSKRIVLHFPKRLVNQPIICTLVRDYNLEFNILKASVTPKEEGLLIMDMSGIPQDFEKGLQYLADSGVETQPLSQNVIRNEAKCTHCGACVTVCPSNAFEVNPLTREVIFWDNRCIACSLCLKACPPRAMELRF